MVYYILIIISLASLAGLIGIVGWRVRVNRQKNLDYQSLGNYAITGLVIDYIAFRIVRFFRELIFKSYLFLVHFVKNCISTSRFVIVKIERRFNHLAANMPEPDEFHKTDKVSHFLREIKDHKENVMMEIKNGAIEEEFEK
jgi:hypothetical protein